MQFSFDISSSTPPKPADAAAANDSLTGQMILGVLQQMLDVQKQSYQEMIGLLRDHLNHARALHAENLARWKNILARWEKDYPDLPGNCKKIYPVMERTYLSMLNSLSQDLADQGEDAFDSEFALQDFLDRNGMKIGQFAHLLSVIGPLSEAGGQAPGGDKK